MRILGYGVEPLPEGIFGRVAVEVGIYLYERLLQQVVRILWRGRALQEQTPYGVAVAVEEVFECRMVAREGELHKASVVGDDVVGYLHTPGTLRTSDSRRAIIMNGLKRSKIKKRSATPCSPTRLAIDRMRYSAAA